VFRSYSGRLTAFKWYASGCRTLEDVKAMKGGIKLSTCQEIGIRFYDGECGSLEYLVPI